MQTPPHLSEISHPACPQLLPSHRPFTLCSRLVLSELRPPVRETEPTTSSGSPSPGLGGGSGEGWFPGRASRSPSFPVTDRALVAPLEQGDSGPAAEQLCINWLRSRVARCPGTRLKLILVKERKFRGLLGWDTPEHADHADVSQGWIELHKD